MQNEGPIERTFSKVAGLALFRILLALIFLPCLVIERSSVAVADSHISKRTYELKVNYAIDGASNVYLVWGIDGWQTIDKSLWPANTSIKNKLHQTTMKMEGNSYAALLKLPTGSTLQYGFFVEKREPSDEHNKYIWDGDYRTSSSAVHHFKYLLVLENARLLNFVRYVFLSVGVVMLAWLAIYILAYRKFITKRAMMLFCANVIPVSIILVGMEVYFDRLKLTTLNLDPPKKYQFIPKPERGLVPDNVLGWVTDSGRPGINPQGFRDKKDFKQINNRSSKIRVMLLGDSFIWGVGVKAHQNLPAYLGQELGEEYEIYNLAVPGWGIGQMYTAYQRYKKILDPDIVLLVYIDNDILRTLSNGKPNFSMHGDVLNFRNRLSRTDHIFNSISNFSTSANLLLKEFFYAPLARDVSATIFQDMHQDIEHHGGEFLVVRIPVPALGQYAYSIMNSRAGLNGRVDNNVLKFIDLSGAISKHADARTRLYLNDPGTHFSDTGNRSAARYLAGHLRGYNKARLLELRNGRSTRRSKLISKTIQYKLAEKKDKAGDIDRVFLVWGINGWQMVEESLMPPKSKVANNLIFSPMRLVDGRYETRLTFPSGTIIDYNVKAVGINGNLILYDNNDYADYHYLIK